MLSVNRRALLLGAAAFGVYASVRPAYVFAQAMEGPFKQVPLPYAFDKNEPHIDAMTMEIHHGRHHVAFINNLNNAAKANAKAFEMPIQEMLAKLANLPEGIRTVVRNSGGGHANHSMFWQVMGGSGGEPTGEIADAIKASFGDFSKLQEQFNTRGAGVFGSGWVFVTSDKAGKLSLEAQPNQDSPLMYGRMPIFGNDVWEHAYYLKYQNRRPDYLKSWWNVVNWDVVNQRYADAKAGKFTL
ncbi:MAG TPA: superoxide dismutase [Xanthobacteraceae bacterium]|nr:superoxide dismutase [Xanthobacteraceae bacterium]